MLTKRTSNINNDRKYALDTLSRYTCLLNIDSDSTGWKENIYHGIFANASTYCIILFMLIGIRERNRLKYNTNV